MNITVEEIATEIVNARVMRKGSPAISNGLSVLPKNLREEVMAEANAVLDLIKSKKEVSS